jgi:hypothetical protein
MLLRSGGDRSARRTVGDGLLSLRKLTALSRSAGEHVHVLERGEREPSQSHISVDYPTLSLIDVRIAALRNFPFEPKVHLKYAETVLPMKDGCSS